MEYLERIKKLSDFNINVNSIVAPSVYLLYNEEQLVYVGSSISFFSRVARHAADKTKIFTHIYVKYCEDRGMMLDIERYLIGKYKPIYNKMGTGRHMKEYNSERTRYNHENREQIRREVNDIIMKAMSNNQCHATGA